jgi:hypothetical protein
MSRMVLTETIHADIVGITFRNFPLELWKELKLNTEVTLQRESDNSHDKYAIKVLYKNIHLGYIQREISLTLSPILDKSSNTTSKIIHIYGTPTCKPHIELEIMIKTEE